MATDGREPPDGRPRAVVFVPNGKLSVAYLRTTPDYERLPVRIREDVGDRDLGRVECGRRMVARLGSTLEFR
ncbi:hypothetical protein EA472_11090 [Natrarchaeobius oligotrophus]|uniref:Uncharacterized protein n=1 Tax=Natrarchaeobius chitinivorans TaxID=1679083 RepID=A0A3N6MH51_NATCH|nr:hypothetical protein EA472_11090 [Natrarchaeobius chitinivorans]